MKIEDFYTFDERSVRRLHNSTMYFSSATIKNQKSKMKTRTIKQTINFSASPEKLFDILMSGKTMSAIHGGKTTMNKRTNGKFTVFDGYCHGYNIELDPGKKIVQAWHFKEEGWPDDHFSICTFLLTPTSKGTKLTFTQTDVPASAYDGLNEGWKDYYWEPLQLVIDK